MQHFNLHAEARYFQYKKKTKKGSFFTQPLFNDSSMHALVLGLGVCAIVTCSFVSKIPRCACVVAEVNKSVLPHLPH